MTIATAVTDAESAAPPSVQIHPASRRIMRWVNALAFLVMIGSGWRIYDYYPALPINFGFRIT